MHDFSYDFLFPFCSIFEGKDFNSINIYIFSILRDNHFIENLREGLAQAYIPLVTITLQCRLFIYIITAAVNRLVGEFDGLVSDSVSL